MPKKRNPAALAGADRAGISIAVERRDTRKSLQTQAQQRLRRQQLLRRLHDLGGRATAEFINEIVDKFGIEAFVDERLAAYTARLTPAMLAATGGDRFPPRPLRLVADAR
jgi:hypothetical protein